MLTFKAEIFFFQIIKEITSQNYIKTLPYTTNTIRKRVITLFMCKPTYQLMCKPIDLSDISQTDRQAKLRNLAHQTVNKKIIKENIFYFAYVLKFTYKIYVEEIYTYKNEFIRIRKGTYSFYYTSHLTSKIKDGDTDTLSATLIRNAYMKLTRTIIMPAKKFLSYHLRKKIAQLFIMFRLV